MFQMPFTEANWFTVKELAVHDLEIIFWMREAHRASLIQKIIPEISNEI